MTELEPWPEESPPSVARVFDHYLGGTDNTEVDREFAAEVDTILPRMGELCRSHRRFSAAAVDHLAATGIDQFLELGAGLPTVDHVHTRARRRHPGARVVYVDRSAVDVDHARTLLAGQVSAPHWSVDGPARDAAETGSGLWGVVALRAAS